MHHPSLQSLPLRALAEEPETRTGMAEVASSCWGTTDHMHVDEGTALLSMLPDPTPCSLKPAAQPALAAS